GTCRQPIRASHLAMRFSRKHPRRCLWLRDRENWIHDIFRAELTDRNPGGGAVLVCVAKANRRHFRWLGGPRFFGLRTGVNRLKDMEREPAARLGLAMRTVCIGMAAVSRRSAHRRNDD